MVDTNAEAPAGAPEDPMFHRCPDPSCRRQFSRKYSLSEHMKTHTGERPHVPRALVRQAVHDVREPRQTQAPARLHRTAQVPRGGLHLQLPERPQAPEAHEVPLRRACALVRGARLRQDLHHHGQPQPPHEEPALRRCAGAAYAAQQRHAGRLSPTTADAWRPETQLAAPQCRLKRAWSTGTNPLPQESAANFNRKIEDHLAALDETLDNLSALLIDTGLDGPKCGGDRQSCLVDDIIRFHVQELGYP